MLPGSAVRLYWSQTICFVYSDELSDAGAFFLCVELNRNNKEYVSFT